MKLPQQFPTQTQEAEFARAILKECEVLRQKITACRIAWDRKSFEYLRDTIDALRELHDRWCAGYYSLRSLVEPPYDLVTPMERNAHHSSYTKWLAKELEAWRSLLPTIRRFSKAKDPKTIRKAQKAFKTIHEIQLGLQEVAKTTSMIDLQMLDYWNYHPPKIIKNAA